MPTYQEELAYKHLKESRNCLIKSIKWIDNMEKDRAEMLIPHARRLTIIYDDIKKLNIAMDLLVAHVLKALDD